jgi:hypothetical protein
MEMLLNRRKAKVFGATLFAVVVVLAGAALSFQRSGRQQLPSVPASAIAPAGTEGQADAKTAASRQLSDDELAQVAQSLYAIKAPVASVGPAGALKEASLKLLGSAAKRTIQDPFQAQALTEACAQFLEHRFNGPIRDYADWRLQNGARWRSFDDMRALFMVESYEIRLGKAWPADADLRDVFEEFAEAGLQRRGRSAEVRGVLIADEAVGIAIAKATPRFPRPTDLRHHGEMPLAREDRSMVGASAQWLVEPVTRTDLLTAGHDVIVARVGVVLEHADGVRRPLFLGWYWDPNTASWRLESLSRGAMLSEETLGFDF